MTITTRDQMLSALSSNFSVVNINKGSIANQVSGRPCSMWRATGTPAQAAIPTTAALCTKALTGAIPFTNQTAPATSYLAWMSIVGSNNAMSVYFADRIAHIGGFNLNINTSQTVTGMNLDTLAPPAARRGAANYSDIEWYLEVYSDGGATASNATINVTFSDGTSNNLNVIAVGGTIRAGMMFALTPFIQTADNGKFIRTINSVILSAATGTVGNFGFTALKILSVVDILVTNKVEQRTYWQLGTPEFPNDACIQLIVNSSNTSTGTLFGLGKVAHG